MNKEDNSAHSHTEGSEDKPDFKPEILRWLRDDFVTIKELPDKFTLNDIINCALCIADYAHKTKPKEEESQEEWIRKSEVITMINDYWRFDSNQQPLSSWHEKQDLIECISNTTKK
jgi:hypothetical protein